MSRIEDNDNVGASKTKKMMILNLMGPLAAIAIAIIWFQYRNSSEEEISTFRESKYDKADSIILPEWSINPHPKSSLHVGKNRCTIERMNESDMNYIKFINEYWRQKPVILVRRSNVNSIVRNYTTKQNMIQQFATKSIPIAGIEAYAFREEQTKVFSEYLDQLSNPAANHNGKHSNAKNVNFNFGIDQYGIGDHYVVPDVINSTLQGDKNSIIENSWHFQVAIAGYGVGLPFHWHGDVFAEVLHGSRRWFLHPPHVSPQFNPRTTSQHWFNEIYLPNYSKNEAQTTDLLECTMQPNEVLYVPADWFHATLSLGEAVAITTSFAQQYRNDRYSLYDSGSADHAYMIDAMEQHNFTVAIYHAQQLVQTYRSESFVPYSWLGVIHTLQTQSLESESEVITALQQGKAATERCMELNPYYAPCYVWYSRQLIALSYIVASIDPDIAAEYKKEASTARQKASKLSFDNDDELLDPRWQPKKKKK
jgi:Cupin-like domain